MFCCRCFFSPLRHETFLRDVPRDMGVQVGTIFGEGPPPKIWEGKKTSKIQRDF